MDDLAKYADQDEAIAPAALQLGMLKYHCNSILTLMELSWREPEQEQAETILDEIREPIEEAMDVRLRLTPKEGGGFTVDMMNREGDPVEYLREMKEKVQRAAIRITEIYNTMRSTA